MPVSARPRDRRLALTLVEMLVAMGIIALIAALAVLFLPSFNEQARAARGADQLQGWLLLVKQWAVRDQAPRGIRLIFDTDAAYPRSSYPTVPHTPYGGVPFNLNDDDGKLGAPLICRTLVYIEQPDDMVVIGNGGLTASLSIFGNPTIMVPPMTPPVYNWAVVESGFQVPAGLVQPGDYLHYQGGMPRRIANVLLVNDPYVSGKMVQVFELSTPFAPPPSKPYPAPFGTTTPPEPLVSTRQYRLNRRPRVMETEKPLKFRDPSVGIDGYLSQPSVVMPSAAFPIAPKPTFDPTNKGNWYYDILFMPNGSVTMNTPPPDTSAMPVWTGVPTNLDKINLWVRELDADIKPSINLGAPSLITTYTRTGFITAHRVSTNLVDRFEYTRDPRSSGL